MTLAGMVRLDKDALICDLAETYRIYDLRSLPLHTVATLSAGLRDDSRIKMKLAGLKVPFEAMLVAAAVDRLSYLLWLNTQDGQKGRNRPASILDVLTNKEREVEAFDSPEAFERRRREILEG